MLAYLLELVEAHSPGFIIAAVIVCLVAGWLLATLSAMSQTAKKAYRLRWQAGTAVVTGLGVWTTHFIAMLGYRPDLVLDYSGPITLLSAIVAVAAVGIPIAMSAGLASWGLRSLLGALAGAGIVAAHYIGMAAMEGCVQDHPLPSLLVACFLGPFVLALARGVPGLMHSRTATAVLFTVAACGTHLVAVGGTTLIALGSPVHHVLENIVLSVFTAAGASVLFIGAFGAVAAAKLFEAQEHDHSTILSTALENMSNGLVYLDRDRKLRLYNRRFLEMVGVEQRHIRLGMSMGCIIDAIGDVLSWSEARRSLALSRLQTWLASGNINIDDFVADDGRILEIKVRQADSGGAVLTFDDITSARKAQQRIQELIYIDPLTRLANRRALQQRMEEEFEAKRPFQFLLLDLDRFKTVNDTYGHAFGDTLLLQASGRITEIIAAKDFVARLGGDEFAIIAPGGAERSKELADRITDVIAQPFLIDGTTVSVGCSIGVCAASDSHDANELMQRADVALYESKHKGRGRVSWYQSGMLEAVVKRQMLEDDLRMAIDRNEFYLAYQPVMSLDNDVVVGFEALIRWDHPTLGHVSPAQFIPLAEETGQIVQIGQWVLEEACREAASWQNERHVAVNVSPVQFRSPFLMAQIVAALDKSGLPARRLEVELTETAIVEDGVQIARILRQMRAIGIRIAMDDFGTGYSSLVHLRDFPLDRIKVDRSFVTTAETDRHSRAVLSGITHIARELGTSVLAEGVETEAQLALMRSIGCDAVQGYLIGRPERLQPARSVANA